jgi:hypothetical protein
MMFAQWHSADSVIPKVMDIGSVDSEMERITDMIHLVCTKRAL